jgi:hypothetical protein
LEKMAERGIALIHTTITRWIIRSGPECERRKNRFARTADLGVSMKPTSLNLSEPCRQQRWKGTGADGGTRTRMTEGRGILSPLRLPVSPRPQHLDIPSKKPFSSRPCDGLSPPM